MTSSMRGCCHRPGVVLPDGGCDCGCCWEDCCGVCDDGGFVGVDTCRGVRLSLGSVIEDVVAGVAGCWTVKLLAEDDDRTRAVFDIVDLGIEGCSILLQSWPLSRLGADLE